jgi:hypothetical protein
VAGAEVCDAGAYPGCLPGCTGVKTNFSCSAGSPTTPSVCTCNPGYSLSGTDCLTSCGDGLVAGSEVCDDLNMGGCLPGCVGQNTNFSCIGGSPTSPSVCSCQQAYFPSGALCLSSCGDGLVASDEVCDDGGLGGCLIDCTGSSPLYTCSPGTPTSPSLCSICGDGILTSPEVCDDGAKGGCSVECTGPQNGYTCTNQSPSVCTLICLEEQTLVDGKCENQTTNNDEPSDDRLAAFNDQSSMTVIVMTAIMAGSATLSTIGSGGKLDASAFITAGAL